MRRLRLLAFISLTVGFLLLAVGAGMRVFATLTMSEIERRLLAARPEYVASADVPSTFLPAKAVPSMIRLLGTELWNKIEPVDVEITWENGQPNRAWQVVDAGWYVGSGLPGWGNNIVIAGHSPSRNPATWQRSIFRQLAYLVPGDLIELTAGNHAYTYRVAHVFAIPEREAHTAEAVKWIAPSSTGAERLTLITCWPPHTAANRILVIAYPSGGVTHDTLALQ